MTDAFLGTWIIQPEQNYYQFGNPPQNGTYAIQADSKRYLVTMQWATVEGQDMNMSYNAIPDGKDYPIDPTTGLDSMSMTCMSDKVLDSDAKKDGIVVAYATRVLSEDNNTMTVKQSGKTPDGQDFVNTSVYVRASN
jgi:hypothetical protein